VKRLLNNRYQLENRLGSGGMAMVYRAQDLMLERTVAIKILRTDYSGAPDFRERFRQEAKAAASLSHPNIVTVFDFGLDENHLFIVMEYVPGSDLQYILQQQGTLSVKDTLILISQACNGIGYAHRSGLVHCDVKPQNMLVTPDKRLKVVDFGIARALASIQPDEKHDIVWGSPQYFSPEQAGGEPPSPASDVYSLGVIMFELLTGHLPFNASSGEEFGRMHREIPPPMPRQFNPGIPLSLEQIIIKALSKEPASRFSTANHLGQILDDLNNRLYQQPDFPIQDRSVFEPNEPSLVPGYVSASPIPTSLSGSSKYSIGVLESPVESVAVFQNDRFQFDWITWFLALLTLIIVGGLIPFWIWVYYFLNPPL